MMSREAEGFFSGDGELTTFQRAVRPLQGLRFSNAQLRLSHNKIIYQVIDFTVSPDCLERNKRGEVRRGAAGGDPHSVEFCP